MGESIVEINTKDRVISISISFRLMQILIT